MVNLVKELKAIRGVYLGASGLAEAQVNALDVAIEMLEARQDPGNLLAVIHRAGGHYLDKHGWRIAAEEAEQKYHQLKQEVDQLRVQITEKQPPGSLAKARTRALELQAQAEAERRQVSEKETRPRFPIEEEDIEPLKQELEQLVSAYRERIASEPPLAVDFVLEQHIEFLKKLRSKYGKSIDFFNIPKNLGKESTP